jgi:hypothetical protein
MNTVKREMEKGDSTPPSEKNPNVSALRENPLDKTTNLWYNKSVKRTGQVKCPIK